MAHLLSLHLIDNNAGLRSQHDYTHDVERFRDSTILEKTLWSAV